MTERAFDLYLPRQPATGFVFSSPHSGCHYPPSFRAASMLDEQAIRSSEDAFVDRLFASAPSCGAPLIAARVPRAYVDLNRAPDELDPALVEGVGRTGVTPRISAGLGVIPRVVANGRAIYRGRISMAEAERRLRLYWQPYHGQLARMLDAAHERFGEAILIDCHSMPHEAIRGCTPSGRQPAEVVLGDRFGAAAGAEIVGRIEAAFQAEGLRVARNAPFAGAHITQLYGRPARGRHAIQIEIDRALYMDEDAIAPRPDFEAFRRVIARVVARMTGAETEGGALAAE